MISFYKSSPTILIHLKSNHHPSKLIIKTRFILSCIFHFLELFTHQTSLEPPSPSSTPPFVHNRTHSSQGFDTLVINPHNESGFLYGFNRHFKNSLCNLTPLQTNHLPLHFPLHLHLLYSWHICIQHPLLVPFLSAKKRFI